MAKFCGNCGAKMEDADKACGLCGTFFETNNTAQADTPDIRYTDFEKEAKTKKRIKLFAVIAFIVVVAIIAVNIISGFVGYKGAVRQIMRAYEDYDIDAILAMTSDVYYLTDSENYAEQYFSGTISMGLDHFETKLGHKFSISYEITDSYEISERQYKELHNLFSYFGDFDEDLISEVMIVETDVTASGDDGSETIELEIILSKEDGSWRLLLLEDI